MGPHTSRARFPLWPGSSRVLDALSCYLSLILSILIRNGIQKHVNNLLFFLGGGGCLLGPPLPLNFEFLSSKAGVALHHIHKLSCIRIDCLK